MAQIVLSEAGAVAGARFLPNGISFLGRQVAGAQIGRTLGALAGTAIDQAYFQAPLEGPQLKALHILESREGAGMPTVFGRMRLGGQLVWAGDFTESRTRQGGKGGPRIDSFSYSVSFAVAICEGPDVRVERIWADGVPLATGNLTLRVYPGTEDQAPDPAIEAHLGPGNAPAFRGTAYVVFEDFPLAEFGNRLPQLSFEVVRSPGSSGGVRLRDRVKAVNIIPATGEFVYATQVVRTRTFPGRETPINMNNPYGLADFLVSLDQLQAELPGVRAASLTVGWFGDDLRAETCRICPGVETRDRVTVPRAWRVSGEERDTAYLITRDEDGNASYGGTPADWSVMQGLREVSARGLAVTLTPFLLMDIPHGNALVGLDGLPGQPAFPWRGRIATQMDGTAFARTAVEAFLGNAMPGDFSMGDDEVGFTGATGDWGYRRFILHHAALAKASGACSAILIGSEMRALTRLRDDQGRFPFAEALVDLARDVKAMVGPSVSVSYAADWSEYGAFVPADGSGDVAFPLDAVWASPDVDFVGIDWYPPAGDWRDGELHLDRLAGYSSPGEAAYIVANQSGGEGFDWYYASAADRDAQLRTAIIDTAHGEDWVFRAKDVLGWWASPHHPRPGGVRAETATGWIPQSKPIRFCEIGFPAIDKGINAPNLFYDPKSSESALPPYSSGQRDDVLQSQALIATLEFWSGTTAVDQASVWAWDARPFPEFPVRAETWTDSANWSYGHWLNGRTALAPLAAVIADLGARGGVTLDAASLSGLVEGFAIDGVTSLGNALAPLSVAYRIACEETESGLRFSAYPGLTGLELAANAIAEPGVELRRSVQQRPAVRLTVAYVSSDESFQPGLAEARWGPGDDREALSLELPIAFSRPQAEAIARQLLSAERLTERATLPLAMTDVDVSLNASLRIEGVEGDWRIVSEERSAVRVLGLEPLAAAEPAALSLSPPRPSRSTPVASDVDLLVLDAPRLPTETAVATGVLLAAYADPWTPDVAIYSGSEPESLLEVARLQRPAATGLLRAPLAPGPVHRWDRANRIEAEFAFPDLQSASIPATLASANRLFVETAAGWELIGFQQADLVSGTVYRLTQLLRGLGGTESACEAGAASGARCVLVGPELLRLPVPVSEVGVERLWQAGLTGAPLSLRFQDVANRPWRPAHVRWVGPDRLAWAERGDFIPDDWDAPDPLLRTRYEIEWSDSGEEVGSLMVAATEADIPAGASEVRIRSLSASGQTGDWVSILRAQH